VHVTLVTGDRVTMSRVDREPVPRLAKPEVEPRSAGPRDLTVRLGREPGLERVGPAARCSAFRIHSWPVESILRNLLGS
jgi:hypothetical protein